MTATLLIPPRARFFDASGAPLAFGFVYTYAAGTLTPKTTYTDETASTPNTNPIQLDASGQADIWLDGNYKINLADQDNVQQPGYPIDNVSSTTAGNAYYQTTGTANNYILTPTPALTAYGNVAYYIQPNINNTGPSTLNVSGLGAKDILKNGTTPLSSGDLLSTIIYQVVYDGTAFQIISGVISLSLTGDVTGSGSSSIATTIANNAVTTAKIADANVTLAKIATQAANTVLANATASTAGPTAVALTTNTVLGRIAGNITAVPFSSISSFSATSYTSSDQAITYGTANILAHSLGAAPKLVVLQMVCQTGEAGYSAGDIITVNPVAGPTAGGGANLGLALYTDATNITYRFAASGFLYVNKAATDASSLTAANWKVRVHAYV